MEDTFGHVRPSKCCLQAQIVVLALFNLPKKVDMFNPLQSTPSLNWWKNPLLLRGLPSPCPPLSHSWSILVLWWFDHRKFSHVTSLSLQATLISANDSPAYLPKLSEILHVAWKANRGFYPPGKSVTGATQIFERVLKYKLTRHVKVIFEWKLFVLIVVFESRALCHRQIFHRS